MWSSDSDADLATAAVAEGSSSTSYSHASTPPSSPPPASLRHRRRQRRKKSSAAPTSVSDESENETEPEMEAEDAWREAWPGRHHPKPVVVLAGNNGDSGGVGRSRSLTDDDLEELKGCADLGFGFSYEEIPELRDTLPALELCYSMSQRLLDDQDQPSHAPTAPDATAPVPVAPPPVTNWKISSPGDSPDEVKARLKYWALWRALYDYAAERRRRPRTSRDTVPPTATAPQQRRRIDTSDEEGCRGTIALS